MSKSRRVLTASLAVLLYSMAPDASAAPPSDVTLLTAASGDTTSTLEWVNPGSAGFDGVLVLRRAGAAVGDAPTDGVSYSVGNTIGSSTVACVTTAVQTSCADASLSNGTIYHYRAFAFSTADEYAGGVATRGTPRAAAQIKWSYSTGAAALAPAGASGQAYLAIAGNDALLHRMDAANGTRGAWTPPLLGGPVQSRAMIGDMDPDPDGTTDETAFLSSQDGYLYRYDLEGGALDASRDVVTDAGCATGYLQSGPVVMLNAIDPNGNENDDVVIVATRCGATDNKVMMYAHGLGAPLSSFNGNGGGLGISNASPLIIYRDSANNLVHVPVHDDGGESLVVLSVDSTPAFPATGPYAVVTSIGDLDATPALVRRGVDRLVAVGNTAGEVYLYHAWERVGGAGSSLFPLDSDLVHASDGAVKGISASSGNKVGPLYENWFVWTTDNTLHGLRIGFDGRFDDPSYWSASVAGASAPLLLRFVGGVENTIAYVGSSDGNLYAYNALNGDLLAAYPIEAGTATVGDPTFDFADGVNQGIVVGTSSGTVYWVHIP